MLIRLPRRDDAYQAIRRLAPNDDDQDMAKSTNPDPSIFSVVIALVYVNDHSALEN